MNLFELFVKIGVDDQASGQISGLTEKIDKGLTKAAKRGLTAITALGTAAVTSFANYEQLAGGAAKIFDEMSQTKILNDANKAYKNLGISANQYLAIINDVGATFAATMGDRAGYETAQTGLKAISDYASGTGKNVDELSQKFTLITRSTASYQSIADQFSGILPATSKDFLAQAQAAGILSESYTELTQVPIAEYQSAVSQMLQMGVSELGLANNTVLEAETTISGSFAAMQAAASNFMTAMVDDNADVGESFKILKETALTFFNNVEPKVWQFLSAISPISTVVAGTTAAFIAFKTAAAISGLLTTLTGAWKAYKIANEGATVAQWLLNAAMNANPIVLIVTLIAGLVAAMVTLWRTNEKLRNKLISAWNAVKGTASAIWNGIGDGFLGLVESAKTWGKDLIDNFIGGIKAKWDALKNTLGQTAQSIKDYLGFSEPEKGPLSNFHTYAPDMMDLFIKGIKDNEGKLRNQIADTFNFGEDIVGGGFDGSFVQSRSRAGGSVSVIQNIYSKAQTAADLMEEARYQQEKAVYLSV